LFFKAQKLINVNITKKHVYIIIDIIPKKMESKENIPWEKAILIAIDKLKKTSI